MRGLLILLTVAVANAQSFEVASVRPSAQGGRPSMTILPGGERLVVRSMPLLWLIGEAYGVPNPQISGLPDGMVNQGYDIEAKAGRAATRVEMLAMLRTLLAERFQLRTARATKEMKARFLVVAKGGPKLEENRDGAELAIRKISGNKTSYHNISISLFANVLAGGAEMVVDATGLKANYDFTLDYYRGPGGVGVQEGREPAPDANGPSLETALRGQLGLKLESRKGPVEVLVVEHIERPVGN